MCFGSCMLMGYLMPWYPAVPLGIWGTRGGCVLLLPGVGGSASSCISQQLTRKVVPDSCTTLTGASTFDLAVDL